MHPLLTILIVLLGLPVVGALAYAVNGMYAVMTAFMVYALFRGGVELFSISPNSKRKDRPMYEIIWVVLAIIGLVANSVAIDYLRRCNAPGRALYMTVAITALCLWFVPKRRILTNDDHNLEKTNLVLEAGIVTAGLVASAMAGKC